MFRICVLITLTVVHSIYCATVAKNLAQSDHWINIKNDTNKESIEKPNNQENFKEREKIEIGRELDPVNSVSRSSSSSSSSSSGSKSSSHHSSSSSSYSRSSHGNRYPLGFRYADGFIGGHISLPLDIDPDLDPDLNGIGFIDPELDLDLDFNDLDLDIDLLKLKYGLYGLNHFTRYDPEFNNYRYRNRYRYRRRPYYRYHHRYLPSHLVRGSQFWDLDGYSLGYGYDNYNYDVDIDLRK